MRLLADFLAPARQFRGRFECLRLLRECGSQDGQGGFFRFEGLPVVSLLFAYRQQCRVPAVECGGACGAFQFFAFRSEGFDGSLQGVFLIGQFADFTLQVFNRGQPLDGLRRFGYLPGKRGFFCLVGRQFLLQGVFLLLRSQHGLIFFV